MEEKLRCITTCVEGLAIMSAGNDNTVLVKVTATVCRQGDAATLEPDRARDEHSDNHTGCKRVARLPLPLYLEVKLKASAPEMSVIITVEGFPLI